MSSKKKLFFSPLKLLEKLQSAKTQGRAERLFDEVPHLPEFYDEIAVS